MTVLRIVIIRTTTTTTPVGLVFLTGVDAGMITINIFSNG